ncbi:MAG: 16S rRNA (guanine(966)-N(2))-methyltransferase RsmD [Clostridia bacterium]|nr:16S rRNA (guanine(966)-N(2))-methyltransferase RsmD [Clostridia bacterium]
MRIIGGKNKGKKLKEFKGDSIRPTSDRAKEALFNILGQSVYECNFLDLCAGTGSVGLECYSRGASSITFVDVSQESLKLCKENALSIGVTETFVKSTAEGFLKGTDKVFDIIFFDPPYEFSEIEKILSIVKERSLLSDGGIFIYEHKSDRQSVSVSGFELCDTRKYGIAIFDFYRVLL